MTTLAAFDVSSPNPLRSICDRDVGLFGVGRSSSTGWTTDDKRCLKADISFHIFITKPQNARQSFISGHG
jgi:hypothetical protein